MSQRLFLKSEWIMPGRTRRINGSLIIASGIEEAVIGGVVSIGKEGLIGEISRFEGEEVAIQCYEDTSGVKPGEPVVITAQSLSAELGPGLLGSIYDGLQRLESEMWKKSGYLISRGVRIPPLDMNKRWRFTPRVKIGEEVVEGDIIGTVQETSAIEHRILVPAGMRGKVKNVEEGDFTVHDAIAVLETCVGEKNLTLSHRWPVRIPRPYKDRLDLTEPLITGQRVIDTFFPIAKGGSACIPGGFGTGKTVLLHQFAKWADAEIIVYIGCGERGNEIAELLSVFPELKDPKTESSLMERTVIIANVSNMPVSAREASIYFGVTIAEYYRDQGYNTALMADSTSRWAEALRDISGRLEEIPAEGGYPAYLAERVAGFYERAGRVITLGSKSRVGSVCVIGAVSPPGADFSEPVTSHTMRFIRTFWALDTELAYRRHFPAINWLRSYSGYVDYVSKWWRGYAEDWAELRDKAIKLLQEASLIEETAMMIGEEALPDKERLILFILEMLSEGFLTQDATSEADSYCEAEKQVELLRLITDFYEQANALTDREIPIEKIEALPITQKIMRMKTMKDIEEIKRFHEEMMGEIEGLAKEYEGGWLK